MTRHEAVRKIEAKNGLENYCFTMRNTLNEEKLKDKFEGGDKEKIESAVQETLDWLDKNQLAEKDEFEAKQKELEGVVNPIMMKVYQAAGGGGMPEGGMPGGGMGGAPGGGAGPTVEEVDWSPPVTQPKLKMYSFGSPIDPNFRLQTETSFVQRPPDSLENKTRDLLWCWSYWHFLFLFFLEVLLD